MREGTRVSDSTCNIIVISPTANIQHITRPTVRIAIPIDNPQKIFPRLLLCIGYIKIAQTVSLNLTNGTTLLRCVVYLRDYPEALKIHCMTVLSKYKYYKKIGRIQTFINYEPS